MPWLLRYRIKHYLTDAVWIPPSIAALSALAAVNVLDLVEKRMTVQSDLSSGTAISLLGTLASSMFTFVVFISSALLLAVQLASAQLSPRVIAFLFKDRVTKLSLSLFTFTYTLALAVLVRTGDSVPRLSVRVAAYGSLASLVVFLYLIDHVGKSFRPSGALRRIGLAGRGAIVRAYPQLLNERQKKARPQTPIDHTNVTRIITSPRDGVVLTLNAPALVLLARSEDCIVELVPQIGGYVSAGAPLFRLYGGVGKAPEHRFQRFVALGQERNIDLDPAFAFRIIVDVACKALSPAINDPTTAVLALDQLDHMLRNVGNRDLDVGAVEDPSGTVRLIHRTPGWEDFVHLAVTEIRQFGGESIQITRRLKAMLESMIKSMPHQRIDLLQQELKILQRGAKRLFPDPEDRALANVSDEQGVGGKTEQPPDIAAEAPISVRGG